MTGDRRALRGLAALLATVLVALGVLVPAPARADPSSLCTGYAACKQAGYSHAGYRNNNDTMYWRMYSGHNCTNYVAYRLVQSGMPNTRPWSGGGNASYWGHEMDHLTDRTPMVGAVAWWDSYDGYAGSNGHVAYVERVVSRNEIIVSEDMWGGDFHWRRITKGGSGWPTGFIHFNDAAVTARSGPSISGTARVGEQLTASTGAWRPNASESLQWFAAGKPIAGATGTTLTPTPEQRKKRLSVKVVATKKWYVDGEATSDRTIKVQRGRFERRSAPEVTGTVQVGHTLTTTRGGYSPAPDSTTIQWYADGEPVEGATGRTLRLRPALVGARITSRIRVPHPAQRLRHDPGRRAGPHRRRRALRARGHRAARQDPDLHPGRGRPRRRRGHLDLAARRRARRRPRHQQARHDLPAASRRRRPRDLRAGPGRP